jgi:non-homologous end joining protein Ku
MAPRANWKGYLRLSLVSCPIALYPASSLSEKVSFNRINRKTGNRLKQQNVDSETGEVVSRDDMVRGYEVAKDQYMIVEDEEIEAVQIESTRTIDIDQFVPKNEIDERYIDSPYYIAPALIDLLKKKQAGEKIEPARETPPPRVVNLMDALRASIDAEEKKAPAPSTRARRPAKKKASR